MLNTLLMDNTSNFPSHVSDTLNLLRQNAEEDLSNILHIQSIFPSSLAKKSGGVSSSSSSSNTSPAKLKPKQSPVKTVKAVFTDSRAVLGQVNTNCWIKMKNEILIRMNRLRKILSAP